MKEPINPKDIRKGDLIRQECKEYPYRYYSAVEYTALYDGHEIELIGDALEGTYLLDRPKSREERAAEHLAGTLAMIRNKKIKGPAWFNVDDAAEALASLREWEAKNV